MENKEILRKMMLIRRMEQKIESLFSLKACYAVQRIVVLARRLYQWH